MTPPPRRTARERAASWLLTGPLGHLAGGSLDVLEALVRYWRASARRRAERLTRDARTRLR
ncbi:MAG TPA: hypothetical protein VK765_04400 [Solirubrobacteraceae bacterium]|nr:hypothetical protein [Solirubrobacteraceae bacterium]